MRVEALALGHTSGIGYPSRVWNSSNIDLVVALADALGFFRYRWLARIGEERVWGL